MGARFTGRKFFYKKPRIATDEAPGGIARRHFATSAPIWHTARMTKSASPRKAKAPIPGDILSGAPERASRVLRLLAQRYPYPGTCLVHATPWQLLVATVLSAQCTDERVNMVTPRLFSLWPDPASMAAAPVPAVEDVIRSTGFFRNKARNIVAAARRVVDVYQGEPPRSIAELITLPGVARKTANIVLFGGYGINEGIAVDTHVKRITHRLGLTLNTDPARVEQDLMRLFPQAEWGDLNHRLVLFGREVCSARSPSCPACEMASFCPRHEPPRKG